MSDQKPICRTRGNGTDKYWSLNGQYHRVDGPAIEYTNGTKLWYLNGKLHRPDGPAIEHANGDKEWYLNGKCHRVGGPAAEYEGGIKYWYQNGGFHRGDGPAAEYADGNKNWYLNDRICKPIEVFKAATHEQQDPSAVLLCKRIHALTDCNLHVIVRTVAS